MLVFLKAPCLSLTADPVELEGGSEGVHITMSREGRPSGEAYVVLANPEDLAEAQKKHNQHIGRRYVEGKHPVALCLFVWQ